MKRSKVPQQTNTATKFMFLQDTAHKGIKPVLLLVTEFTILCLTWRIKLIDGKPKLGSTFNATDYNIKTTIIYFHCVQSSLGRSHPLPQVEKY
jgi:hypothetical protein